MQPTRANARSGSNNDYSNTTTTASAATTTTSNQVTGTFPSRPPAHVEQQKRQRLQRQKEIHTIYQRSTSDR